MTRPAPKHKTEQKTEHTTRNFYVLGIPIAALQISDLISLATSWIAESNGAKTVGFTGMHGVMESQDNETIKQAHVDANLLVADGMPLIWIGRFLGFKHMRRRVYGPEFMRAFCAHTSTQFSHFFFGGSQSTLDALTTLFKSLHQTRVVGSLSPPFQPMNNKDIEGYAETITKSGAQVIWVGMGCPKQELLMQKLKPLLPNNCVVFGVGAAFDFNAGHKKSAPVWIGDNGLEWLYRLVSEPGRLWRRYLVLGPRFVWKVLIEMMAPTKNSPSGKRRGPDASQK
jgi:N-acetylglucosaminyldiphosphoundecaprenol N-acetyl-beta-D-mannosaminyltransferase